MNMTSVNIGLFSGGKDSLVSCLVAKVKEVLYCRTGVGLNEDYVKEMCDKFNWELNIVEPKINEAFEDFVRKFSFPHQGMHSAIMGFLKYHPIRKWHREQEKLGRDITFISGRRKKESKRRMRMKSVTASNVMERMKFFSPIFDWETVDVWDYIKKHNLKRSPIYETMHMSGDCMCGAFSKRGESQWLNIFHPEIAKRFLELEKKYGGKWGNQLSFKDVQNQTSLDDLICMDCQV